MELNKKRLWIGIGATVLVGLIIALNIYRNSAANEIPVQVFKVKQEKIETNVLASGKVETAVKEAITAHSNALVQDVLVHESDLVKAGQIIIRLDTSELTRNLEREEANLAVQKANLAKSLAAARPQEIEQDRASLKRSEITFNNARAKYQRSQTLFKEGAISQESLETAYAEYVSAEAELQTARQRLSLLLEGDTRETVQALRAQVSQVEVAVKLARDQLAQAEVKAPMDGVILSLEAEKGQYVTPGIPLAVVGKPGDLQVQAGVTESDGGDLAVGQPVKITCAALLDSEFSGKVTRVGAAAITKTKSNGEQTDVSVTVSLTNFDNKLKPGYTVDLNITTATKPKALVVPYEALVESNKMKEAFVIINGKASKRRVVTGIGNELFTTVEKGLVAGDKVVVNPPDALKEGVVVKETVFEGAKTGGQTNE